MENKATSEINELFNTVVSGNYCIGCGACASLKKSPISMELDDYGRIAPKINISKDSTTFSESVLEVCPFSDKSMNETQIAEKLYASNRDINYDNKLGYHLATYAGYVNEGSYRDNGSSGGMGTWLAMELMDRNLIDGVIHIHQREVTTSDRRLFHYQLSTTKDEILTSAKSRYYPIELSEMMNLIRERDGRYLIVGIPCFIKAVRLLCLNDTLLNERIKFCVGLICGHLKSTRFAEMFAWQLGIEPNNLKKIDFRTKLSDYGASQYGVTVSGLIDNEYQEIVSPPVHKLFGTNWGLGFFKYEACDYCDDVVAETADVTIGDAWLPQYLEEYKGTNVVIVRNQLLNDIINQAVISKRLFFDVLDAKEVIKSQDSGFRHRREGLTYRLFLKDKNKTWRPKKRIDASFDILDEKTKRIQELRILLAEKTHIAFVKAMDNNSFQVFKQELNPIVQQYMSYYKRPFLRRVIGKLKRILSI